MGILDGMTRYLTGADLPTHAPARRADPALDIRGLGATPVPWQAGKPMWPERSLDTYRRDGYMASVTVYACVTARAKAVSAATLRVYRDIDAQPEEVPDHPLRVLLQRPNPGMSEAEFVLLTQMFMDVCGFAIIEKVRSANGRVVELWHLRPDWAKPILRDQAPPDWEYRIPGRGPVILAAEDVLVVTGSPSLEMSPMGLSPIAVALREIGIDSDATSFLKLFFQNGGAPRYALVSPTTITDQAKADAIRDKWASTYGGFSNWTSVALLHGGLDVKQIGFSFDEMAYPELRRLTEAHICSVFGVPPILIGAQVGLDASTYSNFEEARRTYYQDTIIPLWARLDGALSRDLLPEFDTAGDISVGFDYSNISALQTDVTPAWQRATAALAAGAITLNQFQREVGLPGFGPQGDVLYLPMSAQPTTAADLATYGIPPAIPVVDAAPALAALAAPSLETRERHAMEQRRLIAFDGRRQFARLARRFAPEMARFFAAQGDRITARLVREDRPFDVRALDDVDWLSELEELATVLEAHYQNVGAASYRDVTKTVGVSVEWNTGNPNVRRVMDRLGGRIVGINATTQADVSRVVTEGLANGLSTKDIAANLNGMFRETYRNRALTIARTESQAAYNLSAAEGYKESGVVQAAQLFDNPDHPEDYGASDGLSCAERDGLVVDLDAIPLHVAAEHPNGSLAVSPIVVGLGDANA